ncbi:hypothetical protein A8H31_12670 [Burkholderia thailandensis]|nr:hypothetical protein WJ27_23120 [Burkholderia thailandensis]AVR08496.1 hypothetical protein A8H31_12670 [Burkholderia thailandensis]AWY66008.1 hypothetical protein A8H36_01940 [Burkholderia thailandensis]KVG10401.1 hypothetical protein WJ25_11345 [Burkholderia thailandensis]KVG16926.1 hypothetical protein WJ28_11520 [Burkholderia thailandensis]
MARGAIFRGRIDLAACIGWLSRAGFGRPLRCTRFLPRIERRGLAAREAGGVARGPTRARRSSARRSSAWAQYFFFGGIERRTCLRNLATAAAFFRLRSVVGFS